MAAFAVRHEQSDQRDREDGKDDRAGDFAGHEHGDLIQPWCLAIGQRLGISALAGFVPPYPTLGEASKRTAGSYFSEALFGRRTRRLVRFLARLPVW